MGAQFRIAPPFVRVVSFFEATTSCKLVSGAEWSEWAECPIELFEQFRPYIRPSHQQLLNAAVAAPGSPHTVCSLLRQLLRPHQFKIEATRTGWRLKSSTEQETGSVKRNPSPVKISWD